MEGITVMAKSSSGEPYAVRFEKDKDTLRVTCQCKGAAFGHLCKHRVALAAGDAEMLFDPGERPKLAQANEWVQRSTYAGLLADLNEVIQIEADAKKRVKEMKAAIGTAMNEGIPLA